MTSHLNPGLGPDTDVDCKHCKLYNSYDAQSYFLAGASVLLATVVCFYGYRLFNSILFLVGSLVPFFFTYMYVLCTCNKYLTDQLSGKALEYKHQIFLGISAGVGLIAGVLTLRLFHIGHFVHGYKWEPAVLQMAESSHRATSEEKDSQLENIKNIGNGDQNTRNGCCTSVVQGSSNMDANSLLVDMLKSLRPLRPLENPEPSSSSLPPFEQDFVIDHQRGRQQLVLQPPDADNAINKDVHQPQNPNFQRTRPNLLTQNSWYDVPVPETASPSHNKEESLDRLLSSSMESGNSRSSNTEADMFNFRRSQSDVFGPGTPSQSPRGSTRTRLNTSDISGTQLRHIYAGSFVKDNIVSKVDIMDVLTLHLDRSACPDFRGVPVSKRWEHLADVYKVPDEIKKQCENFTGNQLTPSEAMFECLCTMYDSLTMETLKSKLSKLGRNDVVAELEKNSDLTDELTVTDLCEKHPETLSSVCLKLDDKRSIKNWRHLGIEIGFNEGMLRRLKDPSGSSPSEAVLKKIQTLKPRLPTTELAAVLDSVKLPGIAKVLREFSVSHTDGSTIKTLFDDIDALEKVTALLDLEENAWQRVGRKYRIDKRLLDSLKPDPIQSPTKVVMEYIVQKEPTLTMKTFLRSLVDIERLDVIEDLKDFFYADDIDGIL